MDADLSEILKQAFAAAEEAGMQWPLVLIAASPDGSLHAQRVHEDKASDLLAQHLEAGRIRVPFTLFVLDQNNVALKVIIDSSGEAARH